MVSSVSMRMAWLAVVAWLTACGAEDTFACSEDNQCENAGNAGQCESNGYCSFEDEDCPGGRRYGDLAGGGLAGVCVADDAGTGSTTGPSGSTSTTSGSTSGSTDGPTASTSGSSSGGEDTDIPTACDAVGVCAPPPVPGWNGPVLLSAETDDPCSGDAPVWTAGNGIGPASECACDCSGTGVLACRFETFNEQNCEGELGIVELASDECQPYELFDGVSSAQSEEAEVTGCDGEGATVDAGLTQVFSACEPTTVGRCDDGASCVEQPSDAQVCRWRDGVQDCPGTLDQRTILYRSAAGGYDCGCACGSTGTCSEIEAYIGGETCAGGFFPFEIPLSPECVEVPADGEGVFIRIAPPACQDQGSRNTPEPLPRGQEPAEAEPVTVCCQ